MKTTLQYLFLFVVLGIVTPSVKAQDIIQDSPLLVYYMPKTSIQIVIEYDEYIEEVGPYYQYSKRFLNISDVIKEDKTSYKLTNIYAQTYNTIDSSRVYYVNDVKGFNNHLLRIDNGRLVGYNMPFEFKPSMNVTQETNEPYTFIAQIPQLMEEQIIATNTAKLAEGIAKQIYRLRETRINILAGDVEHAPADGKAMQLVLDEINRQEQELVAMFIGKTTIKKHTYICYYTPNENEKNIVLRFSKHIGPVHVDDLSGEPITIQCSNHKREYLYVEDTKQNQKTLISPIYYNLPGSSTIQLRYKNHLYVNQTFDIAQFGIALPLSQKLFRENANIHILFDQATGNIQSIWQ